MDDPICEMLPHKDIWLPPAFGVWGCWFFRWWGRGDLAVECSFSFLPSGLGWDLLAGIPRGPISLDPPWRVFLALHRSARKRAEKTALPHLGSCRNLHFLTFLGGQLFDLHGFESSRTRPAIKSFSNSLLLLLFICCFKGIEAVVGQTWTVIPLSGAASEPTLPTPFLVPPERWMLCQPCHSPSSLWARAGGMS